LFKGTTLCKKSLLPNYHLQQKNVAA